MRSARPGMRSQSLASARFRARLHAPEDLAAKRGPPILGIIDMSLHAHRLLPWIQGADAASMS
ncbi:hypothetical protein C27AD_19078 [Salinisphaera hydrothermalis C27AD]